uniref:G1/S-specific cyclin-D3 n=1 Tax=Lepeophtheirus salmonis TaxID=72036 RepID=D3PK44_LEPSM|nr:G1/S-specific cyclin-D3 [Lepeophtheirus salmonis]
MSALLGPLLSSGDGGLTGATKAYDDPVIFRDDRVLDILMSKESNYVPAESNYLSTGIQHEIKPHNRWEVADWMLEVCEDRGVSPEVFVLAMNYLDRFLSVCTISKSQLQLLGAVCLLVSWKVREHRPLPASKLVEYSDFNLTLIDIMEWEVLLLSKLDWDMSAVIASDFLEHIVQRLTILDVSSNLVHIRQQAEARILLCSSHYEFSSINPSLIAIACVLASLEPHFGFRKENLLEFLKSIKSLDNKELIHNLVSRIENLMKNYPLLSSDKSSASTSRNSEDLTTPTKLHDVVAKKYARH